VIYENFNYESKIGLYPFLRNYPKQVINYDMEPFASTYRVIEEYLKDPVKGIWFSSPSPINTGSLIIPIAVKKGITYINMINMIEKEETYDDILRNDILIVDEVGAENPKLRWMFDKLVHERFSKGLLTFFGSMYTLQNLNTIYHLPTVSKVGSMVAFSVIMPQLEQFVKSTNTKNTVSIARL
jgi:hypothetical protein